MKSKYQSSQFPMWTPSNKNISTKEGFLKSTAEKGLKTYYKIYNSKNESKPIIILIHGTGNSSHFPFISLIDNLIGLEYTLLTFDLPGHGTKSTTNLSPNTLSTFALDIDLFLSKNFPNRKKIWIGHSIGGTLAFDFCCQRPSSFDKIILISSPIKIDLSLKVIFNELFYSINRYLWKERVHYGIWGLFPAIGKFKRNAFPIRTQSNLGYIFIIKEYLTLLTNRINSTTNNIPTLLIYGDKDLIASKDHGDYFKNRSPNSQLHILKNSNHYGTIFNPKTRNQIYKWLNNENK